MKVRLKPTLRAPRAPSPEPRQASLHRLAEKQVMLPGRFESSVADRERDLSPVPGFVHEDMEEQFARGHGPLLVLHVERPHLAGLVFVQRLDKALEFTSYRRAVIEQRRGVLSAQAGGIRQPFLAQPLKMPPFTPPPRTNMNEPAP